MKRSYETDFWIIDHGWYVNIHDDWYDISVYTIQCPLTIFNIHSNEYTKMLTTVPDHYPTTLNNIKTLNLLKYLATFHNKDIQMSIHYKY